MWVNIQGKKDIIYKNSLLQSFSNYIQYICIISIAIVIKTELLIATVPDEQGVVSVILQEITLKSKPRIELAQHPM